MDRKKLEDIGARLDLDEKDIAEIRRRSRMVRLFSPVVGTVIVMLSTLMGYIRGAGDAEKLVNGVNGEAYPYALPMLLGITAVGSVAGRKLSGKARLTLYVVAVLTVLLSIIGYVVAYNAGWDHYSMAIEYGVFDRTGD